MNLEQIFRWQLDIMVPQVSQKNQIEAMVLVVNSCRQSNAYVSSEKNAKY